MPGRRRTLVGLGACGLLLAACGETPVIREASTQPPLLAPSVQSTETGDSSVTLTVGPADFRLDDARLLLITAHLHSSAAAPQTVAVHASLFDADGTIVGDASGGAVQVKPGADISVQLNGPTPTGTIARATFEVHTTAAAATP